MIDDLIIYVNLIIEVKLYLNISDININKLNARDRLLKFYDQIFVHSNFKDVNKSDFKKIKKRYRNQHDNIVERSDRIFKKCFTFIEMPPLKKQTLINFMIEDAREIEVGIEIAK